MRTRLKTTALAASAAALLAASPAMASGDMDKQAGDTGVTVPKESAATDMEKDSLAHRAADEGQSAEAGTGTGDGESPADPSLSENVDQDDDGNLIADEGGKEGTYDGSVAENADTDQDGNLIADEEKTD